MLAVAHRLSLAQLRSLERSSGFRNEEGFVDWIGARKRSLSDAEVRIGSAPADREGREPEDDDQRLDRRESVPEHQTLLKK